jgi:hypothetical protein
VTIATVLFVADFEEHFDAGFAERGEPHRAAVINFHHVSAGFGDVFEQMSEHSRSVENEQLEHYVASLSH